jgi:AAHS family 3-hydroxyphenylpropionic acid transporter
MSHSIDRKFTEVPHRAADHLRMPTPMPAASRSGAVIAVCFVITALEGYDLQAFGVAAPRLVHSLALNGGQQGWIATAAMIGLVAGAFAGGWLSESFGRKPVLLASVIGFGACSLWTAMSHDYPWLLAARFVTGLGFGGALPNLIAIAGEISAPRRRAATTSAIFCGLPAGGAAVAMLAKLMGAHMDWRMIFAIGGALPLLAAPLVMMFMPETRPAPAPGAITAVRAALFGKGQAAHTVLLWIGSLLTILFLYLMLNWLPTLVVAKGFTPGDGASAAFAFNLTGIVGALVLGFVVDRIGFRWALFAIYGSLALVVLALVGAGPIRLIVMLSGAAGFLVLGAQFALYGLTPILYPVHARASGAGAAVAFGRFGSIIGPLMAGQMRLAGWSAAQVLTAMLPVVVVAGAAVFALSFVGNRHDR